MEWGLGMGTEEKERKVEGDGAAEYIHEDEKDLKISSRLLLPVESVHTIGPLISRYGDCFSN